MPLWQVWAGVSHLQLWRSLRQVNVKPPLRVLHKLFRLHATPHINGNLRGVVVIPGAVTGLWARYMDRQLQVHVG
jgi:hypothetical protein